MKPVLLLLPGMLNDERVWAEVTRRLPAEAAEVCVASLTGADSVPAMADAAWDRVAEVPAGTPLLLAGFSLGGYVAIEMLAHPRRRVSAAALVSTQARPESPGAAERRRQTLERLATDFEAIVDGIVAFSMHAPDAALREHVRAMLREVGPDVAARQMRAIMARGDHRSRLADLALPVAVLCGREDRIVPSAAAQELAHGLPHARLQLVEGAGHMLPMERPDTVAQALAALLAAQLADTPAPT